MNAARRKKQKARAKLLGHKHGHRTRSQRTGLLPGGKVAPCPDCRPGVKTWDRDLAGKAT